MASIINYDARDIYREACRILRSGESRTRRNERLAGIAETHPAIVAAARRSMKKAVEQSRTERIAELRARRAERREGVLVELVIKGEDVRVGDTLMYIPADPSTWLTIAAIDRETVRNLHVHFEAVDAAGKRVRHSVPMLRKMPIRRPISAQPAGDLFAAAPRTPISLTEVCHV